MTLFKLKSAPIILLEDDSNKNILPLLLDLMNHDNVPLKFFTYEQPISYWENVFKVRPNTIFYEHFKTDQYKEYINTKCSVLIDSVNQMSLCLGWNECLKCIKRLINDNNVIKLTVILHKDCLLPFSKLQIHLNHIATAVVSYDLVDVNKIRVNLKKAGKYVKSEELLSYDAQIGTLKCTPIVKEIKVDNEPEKPMPENLSTFKIEVDQTEKIEKYKLKLPYMSKINEGESKVYYEPDAVDDWDEEDPDEDLDI
ncbi:elongator complex protein 5 [Aphomia sociella]